MLFPLNKAIDKFFDVVFLQQYNNYGINGNGSGNGSGNGGGGGGDGGDGGGDGGADGISIMGSF